MGAGTFRSPFRAFGLHLFSFVGTRFVDDFVEEGRFFNAGCGAGRDSGFGSVDDEACAGVFDDRGAWSKELVKGCGIPDNELGWPGCLTAAALCCDAEIGARAELQWCGCSRWAGGGAGGMMAELRVVFSRE